MQRGPEGSARGGHAKAGTRWACAGLDVQGMFGAAVEDSLVVEGDVGHAVDEADRTWDGEGRGCREDFGCGRRPDCPQQMRVRDVADMTY